MADNKIGGLPVVEGDKLVGIITETDVFKILVELLGARTPGLRITVAVTEGKGVLAQLTQALAELGANIISVVTYAGQDASQRLIMVKLSDVDAAAVRERARRAQRPGGRLPRGITILPQSSQRAQRRCRREARTLVPSHHPLSPL